MANYITTQELKEFISVYGVEVFANSNKVYKIDMQSVAMSDVVFNPRRVLSGVYLEGKNMFEVSFTSPTEYRVFHTKAEYFNRLYLGSGDVAVDFVTDDIIIQSGAFSGPISIDDTIEFSIDSYISEAVLESVIEDAENEVDNYAKHFKVLEYDMEQDHLPLFLQNLPLAGNYADLNTIPVFREVKLATKKWTLAFMLERAMLPMGGGNMTEGFNKTLKNSARKSIEQLIERYRMGLIQLASRDDVNRYCSRVKRSSLKDIDVYFDCKCCSRCGCKKCKC